MRSNQNTKRPGTYVIRTSEDLWRLVEVERPRHLHLAISGKPDGEIALWQARLTRVLWENGWAEAAMGLLVAAGFALIACGLGWMPGHGVLNAVLGIMLLSSFGAATGQLIGLARARQILRDEIEAMCRWIEAA